MNRQTSAKCCFGKEYTWRIGKLTSMYLQPFKETVQTFIESLEIGNGEVITFGDYGSYNGCATTDMILHISDLLRTRNKNVSLHVIYEDVPSNDFNALVKTVSGNDQITRKQNLFLSMCPVGFYDQCQPDNTFHVIVSSFAVHFLSTSVSYRNSLFNRPDATAEEKRAAETQAACDWIKFLTLRAKEMKSGAIMMLTMPVEDTINSKIHMEKLWPVMTQVWRQMKEEELISQMEYECANYQGYYRTEEELRAPFREGSTVHLAGLYIQSLDIIHQRNMSTLHLICDMASESKKQAVWAQSVTETVREWTEYIFLEALVQRKAASRREMIDTFYTRLVDKLKCEDREDSGWENIICYLVIRKR